MPKFMAGANLARFLGHQHHWLIEALWSEAESVLPPNLPQTDIGETVGIVTVTAGEIRANLRGVIFDHILALDGFKRDWETSGVIDIDGMNLSVKCITEAVNIRNRLPPEDHALFIIYQSTVPLTVE